MTFNHVSHMFKKCIHVPKSSSSQEEPLRRRQVAVLLLERGDSCGLDEFSLIPSSFLSFQGFPNCRKIKRCLIIYSCLWNHYRGPEAHSVLVFPSSPRSLSHQGTVVSPYFPVTLARNFSH